MSVRSYNLVPLISVLALSLSLSDCKCQKDKLTKTASSCANGATACKTDEDCPDHDNCVTVGDELCCAYGSRTCKVDADCCPGQICKSDGNCFDERIECPNGQSDCGDPGTDRVCLQYNPGNGGASDMVCSYAPCNQTSDCPSGTGQVCWQGFCLASPPCGGSCPAGSICIPENEQCWDFGTRCNVSCSPGYLAMESNPTNIWDTCNNRDVECVCDPLPPLVSTDLGRYSSSTNLGGNTIAVSMYDGQYGDLVVAYYDNTGALKSMDYVDGVPATGTVVADPMGPRGGISDPGPDVGKYTSITSNASGVLYVSYYDVDNKALKLAIRSSAGQWTTQTVDNAGDVGRYTSIALDEAGNPAIAYFQAAGAASSPTCPSGDSTHPDLNTGLNYAHASSPNPTGPSSWTLSQPDCAPMPAPNCYGCTSAQTCVTSGTAGVCVTPSTGCTGCTSSQVCGDVGSGLACQTPFTTAPLVGIPQGRGLMPSLAFSAGTAVIAYYDHTAGNLLVAQGNDSNFSTALIDGNTTTDPGDIGLFPSLLIESSGTLDIAYHDAADRSLRFYSGNGKTQVSASSLPQNAIIDTGLEPPTADGPSFVGGNVHLHLSSSGSLFASYQNSTAGSLLLAERETAGWTSIQTWSTGFVGFFSSIAELPGSPTLFVSHAQIHAKLQGGQPSTDNSLHMQVITPH